MEVDKEKADAMKLAVKRLFDTQEGSLLIEFFEEECGKYGPGYDAAIPATIQIAAGKREFLAILYNFNRLTSE